MNVRISGALLLSLCLFTLNCGSSNPLAPGSLAGTYNLVSITDPDGTVSEAGEELMGTLVLTRTTYTITLVLIINGSEVSASEMGTYTISGSEMTLTNSDGESAIVTISVSGRRLHLESGGTTLTFNKR